MLLYATETREARYTSQSSISPLAMHPHTKQKLQFILLVTAGIYTIALLTATHVPHLPSGPAVSDKLIHFAAYTPLACILVIVLRLRGASWITIAATSAGLIMFAAIDEVTQGLVPGRTPDVRDWMADAIGVLLGATMALVLTCRMSSSLPQENAA